MAAEFNVPYQMKQTQNRYQFVFYCEISNKPYVISEFYSDSPESALKYAKGIVRQNFNRCQKCGRWICDEMYNEEEMKCVLCSPKDI